jgi:RNA polymerase sigma factor (sigma-70 family)
MAQSGFDIEIDEVTLAGARRGDVRSCERIYRAFHQPAFTVAVWGWLRRVVVNHAISTLRKMPQVEVVEFQDFQTWDAGEQERIGEAMDLDSALQRLGDEDRAIVWLHDVEGYKHREIARLFGMTESFSKTRLARARQRLRALIELQGEAAAIEVRA